MTINGVLTDAGIKDALNSDEIGISVQVFGWREGSSSGPTHTGDGLQVNINEFVKKGDQSDQTEEQTREARTFESQNITGSGVDVTFDSFHDVYCVNERRFLSGKRVNPNSPRSGYVVKIPPKGTVSVNTRESISLKSSIVCLIQSKVSNVADGLSHISTTIDPTWSGPLLITFTNLNNEPYHLRHGRPVATVTFHRGEKETTKTIYPTVRRNQERWDEYHADRTKALKQFWWSAPISTLLLLFIYAYINGPIVSTETMSFQENFLSLDNIKAYWSYPVFAVSSVVLVGVLAKIWPRRIMNPVTFLVRRIMTGM